MLINASVVLTYAKNLANPLELLMLQPLEWPQQAERNDTLRKAQEPRQQASPCGPADLTAGACADLIHPTHCEERACPCYSPPARTHGPDLIKRSCMTSPNQNILQHPDLFQSVKVATKQQKLLQQRAATCEA